MNKSYKFWNSRGKSSNFSAGSNDPLIHQHETKYLKSFLKNNLDILDAGCGNGLMLSEFSRSFKFNKIFGFDFSDNMIASCKERKIKNSIFFIHDLKKIELLKKKIQIKFDVIFTKRSIINIKSRMLQMKVIDSLGQFLKNKGKLICCESSQTSLDNINYIRKKVSLKKILPPWHNTYISDKIIKSYNYKNVRLKKIHYYSSNFYFCSRIINALIAKKKSIEPRYNDPVNKVSWELPDNIIQDYSQSKIYEFFRKI